MKILSRSLRKKKTLRVVRVFTARWQCHQQSAFLPLGGAPREASAFCR